MNVNGSSNLDIARAYIEATNVWNFATMEKLLADNVVFQFPYAPEPLVRRIDGKTDGLAFLNILAASWDSANFHDISVKSVGGNDDEVIATYRADTKIKATGADYKNDYVTFFRFSNGKITEFREYYNPVQVVIATGGQVSQVVVPQ